MSVYDLPHVTVELLGSYNYRVRTLDGYCMTCPLYGENVYKTVGTFRTTYDFSQVVVIPISELPEGAELNGANNDHEVM